MMPWRNIARFVKHGWVFSIRDYGQSALRRWRLSKSKVHLPANFYKYDLSIKHLDSDIALHFSAFDAVNKFLQEKQTGNPLASVFPSYASPFLSVCDRQYDSAYVGRVLIEKPDKEPKYINPIWDDIDQETLLNRLYFSGRHDEICSAPSTSTYRCSDGTSTLASKKELERTILRNWYAPVNFMVPFYDNQYDLNKDGKSCCFFHLVIKDRAWFVYLYQFFSSYYGVKRTREMTMHCAFDNNVIFREIIEKQSKDFEKRLRKDSKEWKGWDNKMCVCFHEAKQLRIHHDLQNGVQERSKSPPVASSQTNFEAMNFSDRMIDRLIFDGEFAFRHFEDEVKAPIQVIPLFSHPSCQYLSQIANGYEVVKRTPKTMYKLVGSEHEACHSYW